MFKIFGTDGVRCKVNVEPMTPDTCLKIAKSAAYLLAKNKNKKNNNKKTKNRNKNGGRKTRKHKKK